MSIAFEVGRQMLRFEERPHPQFRDEPDEAYRVRMDQHQKLIRFFTNMDKRKQNHLYELGNFVKRLETYYADIQLTSSRQAMNPPDMFETLDELRLTNLYHEMALLFVMMDGMIARADGEAEKRKKRQKIIK